MPLTVGVPRETADGERRVALTPDAVKRLARSGASVVVESGAGEAASMADAAFEAAGARIATRADALGAPVVATVRGVPAGELSALAPGAVVVGLLRPLDAPEAMAAYAAAGATAVAMELVPRTTRAQAMDALSAMSTVAGYRAVLLAALHLPKVFPLLTTAAGTLRPARVLVLGAGVAGLQALATARRLGAVTAAFDVRAAAREQVESVGATFVELGVTAEGEGGYARALTEEEQAAQTAALGEVIAGYDAVIATALVPGRRAPLLIPADVVASMAPGSVVVDLAASGGGNCAVTVPGETVTHAGVTVLGPLDLAAEMPLHASDMYARTVANLIADVTTDGELTVDLENDVFGPAVVTHGGVIVHERVRSLVPGIEPDVRAA